MLGCCWFLGIGYSLGYPDLRRDYQKHQVAEYLRVAADAGLSATSGVNDEPEVWRKQVNGLAPTEYWEAPSYNELSLASHIPPLRWLTLLHNSIAIRLNMEQPFPPLNDAHLVDKRLLVRGATGESRQYTILEYMHEIGDRWSAEIPEFTATRDNLYLEVTRLAEQIAELASYSASARDKFYVYYWGKLASVESRAGGDRNCSVETAMVHFGNWLDYWSKTSKRPGEMDAVRDNLIRSLVREQKSGPGGDPIDDDETKCPVPKVPAS